MNRRYAGLMALSLFVVFTSMGCATKKYARNRVNERITPLEARTGELEETSRRNSRDIGRLSSDVNDIRGRVDRAQSQADTALARAGEVSTRASSLEQNVNDLRTNLDKYSLQNTATVNFNFDSYVLLPEARERLDQIAAQIKDRDNFILEIQGFADATGTDSYNNQLTHRRADAVRRYLAEQHLVQLFRMHILGFGEVRAVADNTTRAGRAANRRVEVRLLTRSVSGSASAQTTSRAQP